MNDEGNVLDVLLHLPGAAPRKLSADAATTVGEFLRQAGAEIDLVVVEFDEDDDDGDGDVEAVLISLDEAIGNLANGRVVVIHCHRCHKIKVTVNYKSDVLHRKFAPSTRVRKVLRWVKHKLRLTDADADNLALFRCDGGALVRETTHLGELIAGDHCEVCFDLSKDRNIEGAG